MQGILKGYSAQKGIIIADHDYRSVAGMVNRFCMLDGGALREIGSMEELKGIYYL